MLFNSIKYLVFFPIVSITYFAIPFKYRWAWLLLSSYYFYMNWNPKYAVLLFTSTIITYFSGILIEKANNIQHTGNKVRIKKFWVSISIVSNLGILFFFKYFNFLNDNMSYLMDKLGLVWSVPNFNILLPVGISFYTFQVLSYTIDIYRGVTKAEKHFGRYALFVSFFPQLLAGPIEKSRNLLPQFRIEHKFDYDRVKNGLLLMLWGYLKKIVVADRLAILVNSVYGNPFEYEGFILIIATLFFSFQLYFDFSAYSDIAIGSAQVMGYRLNKNFDKPFFSKSTVEFYKKWHISLSIWLNDYLFIPLSRGKCTKFKIYKNIMVVWITSGIWHGANWNFIIWGILNGLYNVLGKEFKQVRDKIIKISKLNTDTFKYNLYRIVITFLLISFSRIFFRAHTFEQAIYIIKNLFVYNPNVFFDGSLFDLMLGKKEFYMALFCVFMLLLIEYVSSKRNLLEELRCKSIVVRWSVYYILIFIIIIFGVYGPGYNPTQFIYFKF